METIVLKHQVTRGERTVTELTLQTPRVRHLRRTDGHAANSIGADVALLSALSGEPEELLSQMIPEDVADCRVILTRAYKRFWGEINLFDQQGETGDPTTAGTPPDNSGNGSGTSPRN
jgi:hypothetical protein